MQMQMHSDLDLSRPLNQSLNSPKFTIESQRQRRHIQPFQQQSSPAQITQILKLSSDRKPKANDIYDNQLQEEHQQQNFKINPNGLVKRYQLLLIVCLILVSTTSVIYSVDGTFNHIKKLTDYFNANLLGNQNLSLYDEGDNIDQPHTQLSIFTDMEVHFSNFFMVFQDFQDSFVTFQQKQQKNVILEIYLRQSQEGKFKQTFTLQQFKAFLEEKNLRDFLLSLYKMRVEIKFGSNKLVNFMDLIINYQSHSFQMLSVQLQIKHEPNLQNVLNKKYITIRSIQQVFAFFLLCSYLHNSYKIQVENIKLKEKKYFSDKVQKFQKHRFYWCLVLAALNAIIIFSSTLSPICSFLQLLPIFQKNDSLSNALSFTSNLRYALPIVFSVLFPIFIFLNGFVFYSILTYPGDYFDNYTLGLFSYLYQNFQVGTYEIFTQLSSKGNFAYLLYAILYFYMVLVGSNLLPALFSTLIFTRIYQKDLQKYLKNTLNSAVCPQCKQQNYQHKINDFQITIHSPKISPYLKGTISTEKKSKKIISKGVNNMNGSQEITKMFVELQNYQNQREFQLNSDFRKIKSQKIRGLCKNLNNLIFSTKFTAQQKKLFIQKIQSIIKNNKNTRNYAAQIQKQIQIQNQKQNQKQNQPIPNKIG